MPIRYNDVLGPNQMAAKRLARYEDRPEQLQMAAAVDRAIAQGCHLAVEAGTGVGKSFAYLVPSILYATADQQSGGDSNLRKSSDANDPDADLPGDLADSLTTSFTSPKRRVVISTHTIALQEQLFEKDIPFLGSLLPFEFTSVLVKGRSNYLCLRRLAAASKKASSLFVDSLQDDLLRIIDWSRETTDGSLSDIQPQPSSELWGEVSCEQGNCLGRECRHYKDCFYQKARRRIQRASLLVVNHALLFSDLAVRRAGGSILPNYDVLIFDEAHTMEQVAGDHLGIRITQGQIDYLLNRLYNDRTHKGLLVGGNRFRAAQEAVEECRIRAGELFDDLAAWLGERPSSNGRVREPGIAKNGLGPALRLLANALADAAGTVTDPENRIEFVSSKMKVISMTGELELWLGQNDPDSVYWLEKTISRQGTRVQMFAAPVDVGPLLREYLFDAVKTVIMTSATLSTGGGNITSSAAKDRAFSFFRKRIGLSAVESVLLGSPFDYRNQVTLVLAENMPDPKSDGFRDSSLRIRALKKYLSETDGGAFILFTGYALLKKTSAALASWLTDRKYPFYVQGEGLSRSEMVRRFQSDRRSVLFGTDSFWQGVDVPGEGLRNVIITRLPFSVPDQPLTEARLEAIELSGDNSFREYLLPQAILKFKQGFGRLVRTATDRGLVIILDPRISTKSYGRHFLQALPDCRMRVEKVE